MMTIILIIINICFLYLFRIYFLSHKLFCLVFFFLLRNFSSNIAAFLPPLVSHEDSGLCVKHSFLYHLFTLFDHMFNLHCKNSCLLAVTGPVTHKSVCLLKHLLKYSVSTMCMQGRNRKPDLI